MGSVLERGAELSVREAGGTETSISRRPSDFSLLSASRPIAIVNEKSPAATLGASSRAAACVMAGAALCSNGSCDCVVLAGRRRLRARYASMRTLISPRHAEASSLCVEISGTLSVARAEPFAATGVWPDAQKRGEAEKSSCEQASEENDESQKLQPRTLDGSIAPHCEHVFVTGAFCAADAPTPVRSETQ